MAHTVELLSLIEDYPEAFLEPTEAPLAPRSKTISKTDSAKNNELLALMAEFPEAFVEPDAPESKALSETNISETNINDVNINADANINSVDADPNVSTSIESPIPCPAGYELAFHQEIQTFGWGTINVDLRYDRERLTALWITVGKSGTEVQSFCEAIARLINRLLAVGTPIPELVKELRGIRGGDSEGLGPHRFLGLVDLFGKVLQDAPLTMVTQTTIEVSDPAIAPQTFPPVAATETAPPEAKGDSPVQENAASSSLDSLTGNHQWVELSDTSAIASICPECGAELQQVNGCSGGACVVCGYSSCS